MTTVKHYFFIVTVLLALSTVVSASMLVLVDDSNRYISRADGIVVAHGRMHMPSSGSRSGYYTIPYRPDHIFFRIPAYNGEPDVSTIEGAVRITAEDIFNEQQATVASMKATLLSVADRHGAVVDGRLNWEMLFAALASADPTQPDFMQAQMDFNTISALQRRLEYFRIDSGVIRVHEKD